MSSPRPMSPLGATLFNLLGESLAPVPVSPIRPNETALGYARRVADTELDALDSLARVDLALHGVVTGKSSLVPRLTIPAAACPLCGGWTDSGGMSQHAKSTVPVMGRTGCQCHGTGVIR